MKTFSARVRTVSHSWYLVDAKNKVLGRLATVLASILRGKHKPIYTPHVDVGDYLVVINANQICLTGNKKKDKKYYRHSGYPGGLKETNFEDLVVKFPERIIFYAVKGMLPKNILGRAMLKKLKVYRGPEHPHSAQQPKELVI